MGWVRKYLGYFVRDCDDKFLFIDTLDSKGKTHRIKQNISITCASAEGMPNSISGTTRGMSIVSL